MAAVQTGLSYQPSLPGCTAKWGGAGGSGGEWVGGGPFEKA